MKEGASAEGIIEEYERTKKISGDDIAVVQARAAELARETNEAGDRFGGGSKEYKDALQRENDFLESAKQLSTESHRAFAAHQGAVNIDTQT